MSNIQPLETISEMHKILPQAEVKQPLVTVVDFARYQEQIYSAWVCSQYFSRLFKAKTGLLPLACRHKNEGFTYVDDLKRR